MKPAVYIVLIAVGISATVLGQHQFETDTIDTQTGPLAMTFIGHGTLLFDFDSLIIHIDPVSRYADYSQLPDADLILITHHHGDHLDTNAINLIIKEDSDIICSESCAPLLKQPTVMNNGDIKIAKTIRIEAVPAYNLVHKRKNGKPFHPKGMGNGYVLTLGDKTVYIAGDTENVSEMKNLKAIDIAFLPMNLPYTMTPQMVAEAVTMFNPKVLYPYPYGETNVGELIELLKDNKKCEIRIRQLQ